MTGARLAAARTLLSIGRRETTLGSALDAAGDTTSDARERGLFIELATGALRWQRELDALVAGASQRAARTIDPVALVVLRLGAYQLRHLDRIPPHAIVSESVETVRALGAPRASGFVNAVLRAMIRRGPALALPARPGPDGTRQAQIAYLSVTLSHPGWLVGRWLDRFGFEAAERWCQFNNTPPSVTVRSLVGASPLEIIEQLHEAGLDGTPATFVDDAVRLPAGTLGRVPEALRRTLWVQDEGAQLVARAADARPGEWVLDLCAAPGGKSIVLAHDMYAGSTAPPPEATGSSTERIGCLVAADFRPARVAILTTIIAASGVPASVVRLDARAALPFRREFDVVLADVPCSGLGTLRREPDLKWTRTADDLPVLASTALGILRSAADVVRPGGRLIYATCSSEPEENGEVVDTFLRADSRFAQRRVGTRIPAELTTEDGRLSTRPDRHGLDAFFAALLVRREGT